MRKLLLLPLLLLLALSSCSDGKEEPAPLVSERIKGTWITVSQEKAYYDAFGQLVYEETDNTGTTFVFDGSKVTSTYASGGGMSGTYTISEGAGRAYIFLTQGNVTQQLEITAIDEAEMSWRSESENVPYFDNGLKSAARAVSTTVFSRQ
jgi:hypothetical protein